MGDAIDPDNLPDAEPQPAPVDEHNEPAPTEFTMSGALDAHEGEHNDPIIPDLPLSDNESVKDLVRDKIPSTRDKANKLRINKPRPQAQKNADEKFKPKRQQTNIKANIEKTATSILNRTKPRAVTIVSFPENAALQQASLDLHDLYKSIMYPLAAKQADCLKSMEKSSSPESLINQVDRFRKMTRQVNAQSASAKITRPDLAIQIDSDEDSETDLNPKRKRRNSKTESPAKKVRFANANYEKVERKVEKFFAQVETLKKDLLDDLKDILG